MKRTLSIVSVIALVAILAVALVACVPSDPTKAVANLEEAGYITSYIKASDGTGVQLGLNAMYEGCVGHVHGTFISTGGSESIDIFYFNDANDAKACHEELKEKYAEDEEIQVGKSGKVVYKGTEAAIKAAQ